jgi:omega-amidase
MNLLKVSFIQTPLYWQDVGANLAMLEEKIWQIAEPTDLIVLPEMFNTGFTMDARHFAEPPDFTTARWMRQMAQQKNAVITGSYMVKSNGKHYNRLCWTTADGEMSYYDKRHLFRMGDEHLTFSKGMKRLIVSYKGWKILPLICYDLRFPVWSRNSFDKKAGSLAYDLLIYVANWPAARTDVWDTLLRARALENQCFCLGVNRLGEDGRDISYDGHSACYSYKGELMNPSSEQPTVQTLELSMRELREFRMKFPAHLDADEFQIML